MIAWIIMVIVIVSLVLLGVCTLFCLYFVVGQEIVVALSCLSCCKVLPKCRRGISALPSAGE